MKTKIIFFAISVLAFGSVAFYPARAIEYGQIGGRPANPDPSIVDSKSWFMYHIEPGQSKEDALEVVNLFQDPWDALIYAADSVKSSSGGFALKQFSEDKKEVGSWVRFYPEQRPPLADKLFEGEKKIFEACAINNDDLTKNYKLTDEQIAEFAAWCKGTDSLTLALAGGEKKQVPFVITIPQNAEVGEHTGGILIQKQSKDAASQEDGSRVLLTTRVGVRIYETVPGEIVKNLQFSDFTVKKNFDEFFLPWDNEKKSKFGEYIISSSAVNGGNVSTNFSEKIMIRSRIFGKDAIIDGREFQVLRGDRFDSTLAWTAPRFGLLTFQKEYTFTDASGIEQKVSSQTISKWFVPWRESSIVVLLLLIFGGAYAWWKKRSARIYGGIGWVAYVVKKTDTVAKISQKYEVDWKVFVKTNGLKAPYILEPGQELLVPGDPEKPSKEATAQEKKEKKSVVKTKALSADISKTKVSKTSPKIVEETPKEKTVTLVISKKIILVIAVVIVAVAVIFAVVVLVDKRQAKEEVQKDSINSLNVGAQGLAQKSEAPDAKPLQENKQILEKTKADLDVHILNGGAPAGSAAKVKGVLAGAGYEKVDTANASEDNHMGIAVFFQDGFQKLSADLAEVLKASNKGAVVISKSAFSDEEKSGEIVVILGK